MMRRRFGIGGAAAAKETAAPAAIEFEDFEPKSEWKEEELQPQQQHKAQLLLLHLPEFKKEQLKVVYVQSTRTLRVSGERPLSDDSDTKSSRRRRRFNVTFPVPHNCDAFRIQGKFNDGVLTVTIPRLPETPAAAAPPPPSLPPPPQAAVLNEPPPPPAAATTTAPAPGPSADHHHETKEDNDSTDDKDNNNDHEKGHDAEAAAKTVTPEKEVGEEQGKEREDSPTTKAEEVVDLPPPKEASSFSSLAAKAAAEMAKLSAVHDDDDDHRRQGVAAALITSRGSSKKRKESPDDHDDGNALSAIKDDVVKSSIGERMNEAKTSAAAMAARKKAKGLGILERVDELMKDEDNRQTMVNVGLAVVAAVAVGAFIVYRYRSFRDSA